MWKDDPFVLYRSVLFAALAVYTGLTTGIGAWRVAMLLRGDDPQKRLLRLYLSYQLVSVRVRPLMGELWQIALWCLVLLLIWWLHPYM